MWHRSDVCIAESDWGLYGVWEFWVSEILATSTLVTSSTAVD
jgi:hypothetical protein